MRRWIPEPTRDDVIAATEPTRAEVDRALLLGSTEVPDDDLLDIEPLLSLEPPPLAKAAPRDQKRRVG